MTFYGFRFSANSYVMKPTVVVVDEGYPSECIKFRSILNPAQSRFRVTGTPSSPGAEEPSLVEVRRNSLPLKPSGKERQRTPSPSQPSEDRPTTSLPTEQVNGSVNADKENLPKEATGPDRRDVLDDVIDETKAAKDLVRWRIAMQDLCSYSAAFGSVGTARRRSGSWNI